MICYFATSLKKLINYNKNEYILNFYCYLKLLKIRSNSSKNFPIKHNNLLFYD